MAPMFQNGYYGQMGPMGQMAPMGQMGQMGQNVNMSHYPAIYAASQPQPAQLYSSGVPGAPPTIAVATDEMQMGGFLMPSAPRPMRNTTQRRNNSQGGEQPQQAPDSSVRINVIKGS